MKLWVFHDHRNPSKTPHRLPNSRLSIFLSVVLTVLSPVIPPHLCKANNLFHVPHTFSVHLYIQAAGPAVLSTGYTSLGISYMVHLKCHLLLKTFSSLQESMKVSTYSNSQTLYSSPLTFWHAFCVSPSWHLFWAPYRICRSSRSGHFGLLTIFLFFLLSAQC